MTPEELLTAYRADLSLPDRQRHALRLYDKAKGTLGFFGALSLVCAEFGIELGGGGTQLG